MKTPIRANPNTNPNLPQGADGADTDPAVEGTHGVYAPTTLTLTATVASILTLVLVPVPVLNKAPPTPAPKPSSNEGDDYGNYRA